MRRGTALGDVPAANENRSGSSNDVAPAAEAAGPAARAGFALGAAAGAREAGFTRRLGLGFCLAGFFKLFTSPGQTTPHCRAPDACLQAL